jgi:hypothetical protein
MSNSKRRKQMAKHGKWESQADPETPSESVTAESPAAYASEITEALSGVNWTNIRQHHLDAIEKWKNGSRTEYETVAVIDLLIATARQIAAQ